MFSFNLDANTNFNVSDEVTPIKRFQFSNDEEYLKNKFFSNSLIFDNFLKLAVLKKEIKNITSAIREDSKKDESENLREIHSRFLLTPNVEKECENLKLKDVDMYSEYLKDQENLIKDNKKAKEDFFKKGGEYYSRIFKLYSKLQKNYYGKFEDYKKKIEDLVEQIKEDIDEKDGELVKIFDKYEKQIFAILNEYQSIQDDNTEFMMKGFIKALFNSNPGLKSLFFPIAGSNFKAGFVVKRGYSVCWFKYSMDDPTKNNIWKGQLEKGLKKIENGYVLELAERDLDILLPKYDGESFSLKRVLSNGTLGFSPISFSKFFTNTKQTVVFGAKEQEKREFVLKRLIKFLADPRFDETSKSKTVFVNPCFLEDSEILALLKKLDIHKLAGVEISKMEADEIKKSLISKGNMFKLKLPQNCCLLGFSVDDVNEKESKLIDYDEFIESVCHKNKLFVGFNENNIAMNFEFKKN